MVKFENEDVIYSMRGVAIVIQNGKLLVQKRKSDKFWALPGGRVEMYEKSENTPIRELEEEIGVTGFKVLNVQYVAESFYKLNDKKHHEIAFYYMLDCPKNFKYANVEQFDGIEKEKNIIYTWLDIKNLSNEKLKPEFLKVELQNITPYVKHIVEEEK